MPEIQENQPTAAEKEKADKEYLDKMRGWLMTVATLFVTTTFPAVLHPPDWLKTEWYSMDLPKKHGKAGSPIAAPAPSPHTADATRGEITRAGLYLASNVCTFGTALALVLVLLWETPYPRRTIWAVRIAMPLLSLCLALTLALGTSDNSTNTGVTFAAVVAYAVWAVLFATGKISESLEKLRRCFHRAADTPAGDGAADPTAGDGAADPTAGDRAADPTAGDRAV